LSTESPVLSSLSLPSASRQSLLVFLEFGLAVLLVGGCASSSIARRKAERAGAYATWSPEIQALVSRGKLAAGMDTNAVFVAWGQPDEAETFKDLPEGPELRWRYSRDKIEDRPRYVFLPSPGPQAGIDVYTIHRTTSSKVRWREAAFRHGRLYWWHAFDARDGVP
jgi:hypothetical protein